MLAQCLACAGSGYRDVSGDVDPCPFCGATGTVDPRRAV